MGNEQAYDKQEQYELVKSLAQNKNIVINRLSKKQFVTVQRLFPTSDQLQSYLIIKNSHLSLTHPYYLNQKSHQIITQANLCSTVHKFVQYFQYQEHSLRKQLDNREKHRKYFSYQEIWSIICSCVLAMAHLSRNQILHFTLNPNDIFIDQNGQIKVISSDLSENTEDHIIEKYYYSPEHLKSFKQQIAPQLTNKSGVFTLGITILQIIFLSPMDKLYNYSNFNLDYQGVYELIQKVQDNEIRIILQKMLKFQSYDRITFTQLEQMLYFILEKQTLQDKEISEDSNDQIQKLQQSIFKIQKKQQQQDLQRTKNQIIKIEQEKIIKIIVLPLQMDQSDINNTCQMLNSQIDKQSPNQEQQQEVSNLKQTCYEQKNQMQYQKQDLALLQNNHLLNTPIFKFSTEVKNMNLETNQKTLQTRKKQQPYFVTEQLSRGKYQGYKMNNMRNGFGTFYYKQGGKYVGQWLMNKMQGRGALYYSNQQIAYEGEWKADKLNGHGVLYNQTPNYFAETYDYTSLHIIDNNWIKYQGNFIQDQKNGQGTLFLSNGQFYRGYFKDDLPHGNGIYKKINGNVIKGTWILGVFQNSSNL